MPALAERMSIRPQRSRTAAAIASTAAGSTRSTSSAKRIGALAAEGLGHPLGGGEIDVGDRDPGPLASEHGRNPGADAAGPAGDDGHPLVEALHGAVPVVSVP